MKWKCPRCARWVRDPMARACIDCTLCTRCMASPAAHPESDVLCAGCLAVVKIEGLENSPRWQRDPVQ